MTRYYSEKIDVMSKIYICLSTIITVFVISSCTRPKKNIIRKYLPSENIFTESTFILNEKDTILDGEVILYDLDSNKIGSGNYVKGKLQGIFTFYFLNKNIKEIRYYDDGIIVGDRIYNFENGKIRKYIFHDDKGEVAFIVRFTEKGNLESYEGHSLVNIEYSGKKELGDLKIGDTLSYDYLLAEVPLAKNYLTIKLLDFDNSKIYRNQNERSNFRIKMKEVIAKKGKNSIRAVLKHEFNDSLKNKILDSIRFDFTVKS